MSIGIVLRDKLTKESGNNILNNKWSIEEINAMVYKLYELTDEEIKVVEL